MNLLFLTIVFPFLGFFILLFVRKSWAEYLISGIGIGCVSVSALITCFIAMDFLSISNSSSVFVQSLCTWISVSKFCVSISFRLDVLSLTMLSLITGIGLLIHIYAAWYMRGHIFIARFFSYSNLFIANMIILVLADNLLLMYFGWEGVGLCSYLLIGFYYANVKNGIAALKAFITTRVGDICLICALFMIYDCCHTLNFHELMSISSEYYLNVPSVWIASFLLFAALAKSAQVPFQSWLLDAMVAPAPVSALVHSATMVTAGVYLILRTYNLFLMTPCVLYCLGVAGSITVIISSCSAIVQTDIKKILAYSTMSQIGYMFLALAVQSWESAIFHLIIHAFFKALLFLSAGSLVLFCFNEQNILKMGGLCKLSPIVYLSFLVGGASLSAVPIVTSGFYSKGDILWSLWVTDHYVFLLAGLLGSILTVIYTFRMLFYIFYDRKKFDFIIGDYSYSFIHYFPLLVLVILSTFVGIYMQYPLLGIPFNEYVQLVPGRLLFECFIVLLVIFIFCLSGMYYIFSYRVVMNRLLNYQIGKYIHNILFLGWGFDFLYKQIFIKPYVFIADLICHDPLNVIVDFIRFLVNCLSRRLILSENGQLRWYAEFMLIGILVIFLICCIHKALYIV